jgi:predicted ATPase
MNAQDVLKRARTAGVELIRFIYCDFTGVQLGEPLQLFPVLLGLWRFYAVRGVLQTAQELGEQLLRLAQSGQDPAQLLAAHQALAVTLLWQGEYPRAHAHAEQGYAAGVSRGCGGPHAHAHAEQGLSLYDPQPHHCPLFLYGLHHGVNCLLCVAHSLEILGYPDRARQQYQEAITRAQDLAHAFTLVHALFNVTIGHQLRHEERATQEQTEILIGLCTEQGFSLYLAWATILRGWALATQGQTAEAIAQMRHGLAAARATGAEMLVPYLLALLAEACGQAAHADEGLRLLAEALAVADTHAERWYEAELYRLKGELLLAQSTHQHTDAEACFQQALNIASAQHAKAWELRAAVSLSRLWQQQGKRGDAHTLLAPIYNWFTEGFDMADLQEAKALLEALK